MRRPRLPKIPDRAAQERLGLRELAEFEHHLTQHARGGVRQPVTLG